ncbi:MAG: amidohydrolase family protein, partial [Spirochaetaceae bacterium]|nr:amidohydrolase family protein [Spirochaetaceae bacterium]
MAGSILVKNIGELCTPLGSSARRGEAMRDILVIRDAAVLVRDGLVEYAGASAGLGGATAAEERACAEGIAVLDACGRAVVPGFVDSHTHFVFAGYRDDEFLWRAQGMPYMEIHARGGGIRRTMAATRAASLEELVELGEKRLRTMLSLGVTTVEGKSGYGLETAAELRQLEAMRVLSGRTPVTIVPTFMGPHSTPPEYQGRPSDYIDHVISDMLPAVRAQGVARFADIFCEKGVFGIEDSRRYLAAAKELGFGL